MTKKKQIITWTIILCILVAGYFIYPLVAPLFIDKKVSEAPLANTTPSVSSTTSSAIYLQGNFVGFDRIHTGTGTAQVVSKDDSYVIRFESDFSVQNGPDLYVGLGKDGKYVEGSEISLLKGNIGSQNYVVDGKFDTEKYNEIWIWCKKFSTPFARAVLQPSEYLE